MISYAWYWLWYHGRNYDIIVKLWYYSGARFQMLRLTSRQRIRRWRRRRRAWLGGPRRRRPRPGWWKRVRAVHWPSLAGRWAQADRAEPPEPWLGEPRPGRAWERGYVTQMVECPGTEPPRRGTGIMMCTFPLTINRNPDGGPSLSGTEKYSDPTDPVISTLYQLCFDYFKLFWQYKLFNPPKEVEINLLNFN